METYEKFAQEMEQEFPKIFAGQYGGFGVDEGWYPILRALCANIQRHIDWKNEQFEKYGRGEKVPQVTVLQIKEKFGGLRFYYQGGDNEVYGMVRMAEEWANHVCEVCGTPGVKTSGGWIKTLCSKHAQQREEERAEYMKENGLEE